MIYDMRYVIYMLHAQLLLIFSSSVAQFFRMQDIFIDFHSTLSPKKDLQLVYSMFESPFSTQGALLVRQYIKVGEGRMRRC